MNPKAKQDAIENIQSFLSKIPASERTQPMAFAGSMIITPERFLREVKEETDFGRQIIDIHATVLKLDIELFELHLQELFFTLTHALKEAASSITGKSESSAKKRDKAVGENSKNLLLIHPDTLDDAYIVEFATPAALDVLGTANQELWQVNNLAGPQATKDNVNAALKSNNIDFVLHYDHGSTSALLGWDKEPVIDSTNADLLSNKALSSVSCFPAFPIWGIGQQVVDLGSNAFLGYDSFHCYENSYHDCFVNSANATNKALLEGRTFLESYTTGLQTYKTELQTISESNSNYKYAGYVLLASDCNSFQLLNQQSIRT